MSYIIIKNEVWVDFYGVLMTLVDYRQLDLE
jgi:hypothetical protein